MLIDVKYQVITKSQTSILNLLRETFKEIIDNLYIEQEDNNLEVISIQKLIKVNKDEQVVLFSILIDTDAYPQFESSIEQFQEQFESGLKSNEEIIYIFKFSDTLLRRNLTDFYKQIFDLEMRLRDVITLIFILNNKKEYHDLLVDYNIEKLMDKGLKDKRKAEMYRSRLENDLFYISFSGYNKFIDEANFKKIEVKDLIQYINGSETMDSLKSKLSQRGISNEEARNFLASIKENLLSIEKMRNCVAHNRAYKKDDKENFEKSGRELNSKIDEFYKLLFMNYE